MRPPEPSWLSARRALVAIAVVVVACSPTETTATSTTTTTSTSTTSTTTTTTTTTIPATTTTTEATTTTTLSPFPEAKENLAQGGEAWAVYVAVAADFADPAIADGATHVEEWGYFSGVGDLGCDQGGAEALGLDPSQSWAAVGVYFDTEDDAEAFILAVEARGHEVAGHGLVRTFCLD